MRLYSGKWSMSKRNMLLNTSVMTAIMSSGSRTLPQHAQDGAAVLELEVLGDELL